MTKETTTMLLTIVFMALGILYQVAIGVIYQRMIQQADTLSGTDNKLLKQCKERFINCYKLNGACRTYQYLWTSTSTVSAFWG